MFPYNYKLFEGSQTEKEKEPKKEMITRRPPHDLPNPGMPPFYPGTPSTPEYPEFPYHDRPGSNRPTSPPPRIEPEKPSSLLRIDSGAIRGCLYNYTYIWLVNGRQFWFYPTFIGRESISGYRYTWKRGWVYMGFDLDLIEAFYCVR